MRAGWPTRFWQRHGPVRASSSVRSPFAVLRFRLTRRWPRAGLLVRVAFSPRPGLKPQRLAPASFPGRPDGPPSSRNKQVRLPRPCATLQPFWGAARPARGCSVAVKATIDAGPEHREEHLITYDETTLPFDPITSEQLAGPSPSARLLDDLQRGYQVADLSVVYLVARGTGPMLSSLGAFLLLGSCLDAR